MNSRFFISIAATFFLFSCSDQSATVSVDGDQDVEIPINESTIFITNASIIVGTGEVIQGGSILIEAGRIKEVGTNEVAPLNARVINALGKTVMPGFIEGHRHIIQGNPDEWMANRAEANMQEFLEAGFTTVLSAIDASQILELRRMINDGEIVGPRLITGTFVPVNALPPTGQRGDPARFDQSRPPARPTEQAGAIPDQVIIDLVQNAADAGYDMVKTVVTVTPSGPAIDSLKLMVSEAHRHGLKAIVHAVSVTDALAAIEAQPDHLVHTPHIMQLTEEQAQTIADAGIPMMSTLSTFVPFYDENNQPIFRDAQPYPWNTLSSAGQGPVNARLLWEAGIAYGFGTDTSYLPRDTLKHELKALHLTFSELDIIKIMTTGTAEAIWMQDEIGTLESGKAADIVILEGNPLEDLYDLLKINLVIKGGEIVVNKM
jgi:imidazolonepropionase-like amidohydrolase